MAELNLSNLTEADIITKCVMPAILNAGWDNTTQIRQEVKLRDGKVIVRGKVAARRTVKSADIVLYHKPGIPLAVIEAKPTNMKLAKGCNRALNMRACWTFLLFLPPTGMALSSAMPPQPKVNALKSK